MTDIATTLSNPENTVDEKAVRRIDLSGFKSRMDLRLDAIRCLKAGNDEASPLVPTKENSRI
ncbi:MAG: hypothetical protein IKA03_03265 [Alphaproteobacteria bacterium]|nr:hypothetical protein [Alphaproteobacteria bacterium]